MSIRISNTGKNITVCISQYPDFERATLEWFDRERCYEVVPDQKGYKMTRTPNGGAVFSHPSKYLKPQPPVHEQLTFPEAYETKLCIDQPLPHEGPRKPQRITMKSAPKERVPPPSNPNAMITYNGKTYMFEIPTEQVIDLMLTFTRRGYSRDE